MNTLATTRVSFKKMPKTFDGLCRMYPPRPLHDEVDLDNTLEVIHGLAGFPLNADQEDYLEALSILVHDYEAVHHPIEPKGIKPVDSLKALCHDNDLAPAELGRLLGNAALGAKVLGGEKELTQSQIRLLAKRFKVSPALFI